jgi:succinyl-CoA synthetase alpha subunit
MIVPEEGEPVIVQNITGRYGSVHARLMTEYGTRIAAGVTPGRGGQKVDGVPVYDSVAEAVDRTGARYSVLFVPAPTLCSAAEEALRGGIKLLVIITEHVPIRDTLKIISLARLQGATVVGPNCPGVILPSRRVKLGIMPASCFKRGSLALFSRSGTLTYEVANELSLRGYGQHIALGIGGDPVTCTTFEECLDWAAGQDEVRGVVVVGEIGGDAEERLARRIVEKGFEKPVFAYVAGRTAPRERRMGHAGAIISGNSGTAASKISALRGAGVRVAMTPMELPDLVEHIL